VEHIRLRTPARPAANVRVSVLKILRPVGQPSRQEADRRPGGVSFNLVKAGHAPTPVDNHWEKACKHGDHTHCVHIVLDLDTDRVFGGPRNVVRRCVCRCHVGCPEATATIGSSPQKAKDACTCWDNREQRQALMADCESHTGQDGDQADDDTDAELGNDGDSVGVVAQTVGAALALSAAVGLFAVGHHFRGGWWSLLWLPIIALSIVGAALFAVAALNFMFKPSSAGSGFRRRRIGVVLAVVSFLGGALIGTGVVVTGPGELATAPVLALLAVPTWQGRGRTRRFSVPTRRALSGALLACAAGVLATGVAILA
jgi:hypothetical protein